jgi:hypothetical protein
MMRALKIRAAALVAMAVFGTTPAAAAEGLTCVLDAMPAEAKAEIGAAFLAGRDMPESGIDAIAQQVPGCAERHNWEEPQVRLVVQYTISDALVAAQAQASPYTPTQITRLEQILDRLEPQFGPDLSADGEISDSNARRLVIAVMDAGLPVEGSSGEFIGSYFAARWLQQDAARQFAAL